MNSIVSIIVPCYNMGDFITETLNSVLDYPDQNAIEIIVVNDGSTDKRTIDILDSYKAQNITILHQENMGLGKARNNGISIAKGEYILPLDADNKIRHKFIDLSLEAFETNPDISIVYGDAQFFGEKKGRWKVGPFDFPKLLSANYIDACACYKKEVWESINGYDSNMPVMGSEDWDFWLRAYLKGFKFKYIEEVFFDYRVRKDSMVHEARRKGFEISEYMFAKPELKYFKAVRQRINDLQHSIDYKTSFLERLRAFLKYRIRKFKK